MLPTSLSHKVAPGRTLTLKSVESVRDVHKKQLLTYLRTTGKKLGLLLNFGEATMVGGISRIANGLPENR